MVLRYQSGEEIQKGDRVIYSGNPGEVELVAVNPEDPDHSWYIEEYGGGVMIREPKLFGVVFIPSDQLSQSHELQFVSRK
jgi:hypothetical protein